uniref:cell wall protein PRY3-like isoform X1 n=1 Tax=Osmia lignaria TaxID=473952 RepID=UPI0014782DBC|nr:cell wall protein PRY3-like isoform X1 [Osmia lignaria]
MNFTVMEKRKEAMRLLLRLATSILLTSVHADVSPYHEIVGVGQSAPPFFVAPLYGVAPAVTLLAPEPIKETETIVAGPVTTTTVEGSSSGPVTILSPGSSSKILQNTAPSIEETTNISSVPADDSVLVRGASSGPVILIAPSDNSVAIGVADNAASAGTETKKGVVATSAKASVAIENAEESSPTADASANTTAIKETIGIASANAVIGPSTGPIVITGPTAPPLPIALATSTSSSATVSASTTVISINATTTAAANVSSILTDDGGNDEAPSLTASGYLLFTETTKSGRIEGVASSRSSLTTGSGNTVASSTARVNLIPPGATIVVGETPLSNVVVSAPTTPSVLVSGPKGRVSGVGASSLLFKAPLYPLQR